MLADHTEDVVVSDVPSPEDGVRGLDADRETWPEFSARPRSGASFEVVELAEHPGRRLRLTPGLRREGGRWCVAHEHHSFPLR